MKLINFIEKLNQKTSIQLYDQNNNYIKIAIFLCPYWTKTLYKYKDNDIVEISKINDKTYKIQIIL